MANLTDIQKYFPQATKSIAGKIWEAVPKAQRDELAEAFKGLPLDRNPFNALVDLALIHSRSTFSKPKRVAIIGPANVGKSTLYNQFIKSKTDKAEISPIPGTTRANQEASAGLFSVVDTPGADAVGPVGETERQAALSAAASADFLLLIFDALQGVKQTEVDLYQEILRLNKPYIVVLNKMDLVKRFQDETIATAARNLNLAVEQIVPVSALKGDGLGNITMSIIAADPSMMLTLANAMPQFRRKIAWRSITTASSLSAAIALTPLPIVDFIPLSLTQVGMVVNIARIYQYKLTLARARELIATFGLGMLGKILFYQLSKAGGVPGWVLSSAVATSMTVVIGYASIEWFEKGERVSRQRLSELNKELTQNLVTRLKATFTRKPSRKALKQTVSDLLAEQSETESEAISIPAEQPANTRKKRAK